MRQRQWPRAAAVAAILALVATPAMATLQGQIIDGKPCARADLFITRSGAHYELLPGQTKGITGNVIVTGVVYPKASICKVYPFLRILRIRRAGSGPAIGPVRPHRSRPVALRYAREFQIFAPTPADSVRQLHEAVGIEKEYPHSRVTLYINDGNIESMAKLAFVMYREKLPFRKGFKITAAPPGSPTHGIEVVWPQERQYFHSYDALARYANLG